MMDRPNRPLKDGDREVMVSYLLHTLPENEREAVRERLAAEEEYFAAMQEAEYDLCDAYVRGVLPLEEAAALRRLAGRSRYWRDRIAAARELHRARQPRRRLWIAGVAAGIGLALLGGWWMTPHAENPTARVAAPAAPEVAVFLTPGVLRGGAVPSFTVPETARLRLQLEASTLPREGELRVRIQSAAGVLVEESVRPVRRQEGAAEYLEVTASLPGPGGRYEILVLNADGVAARYLFRLER
jgi:hypothetical protein